MSLQKCICSIPELHISQYLNVFTSNTFTTHFRDTFFFYFWLTVCSVNTNKKTKHLNKSNAQLIITFINPVFNKFHYPYIINKLFIEYNLLYNYLIILALIN